MKTSHIVMTLAALCAVVGVFFLWQPMRKDEPAPLQETAPLNSEPSAESEAGTGMEQQEDPAQEDPAQDDLAQDAAATATLYMELPEILQRMEDGSLTEADYARIREIDAALYPNRPAGTLEQWLRELTSEGKRARDAERAESILGNMKSIASSIQWGEKKETYAQADVEAAAQSGSEELAAAAQKSLQAAQKYLAAKKKQLDATADQLPALKVKGFFERGDAMDAAQKKRYQMSKEASAALTEMLSAGTEHSQLREVVEARKWIERAENLSAAAENDQQRAAAARLFAAGREMVSYKEGLLAKVRRGEQLTTAELEQEIPLIKNAMRSDYEAHMLFRRQGARAAIPSLKQDAPPTAP